MTSPADPVFQVGDIVRRHLTKVTGVVTNIKRWGPFYSYQVIGAGFNPEHYFYESVLTAVEVG